MFVLLQSGTIDLEEFIGGIALCLHGTVKDKCRLLFHIFNLVCSVLMNKIGNLLSLLLSEVLLRLGTGQIYYLKGQLYLAGLTI